MTDISSPIDTPAPDPVGEFAQTCVQYVKSALSFELDFSVETLPVLDHYLQDARRTIRRRPETLDLIAVSAGAYLGEVVRKRHACTWNLKSAQQSEWSLEFEDGCTMFPVAAILVAIKGKTAERDLEVIRVEQQDRDFIASRLQLLPLVSEDEYVAPSTRVEVIDLIVDAVRARRQAHTAAQS